MYKRTFSYLMMGFILCLSLNAQTRRDTDSVFIFHYPSCVQMFKADYRSNRHTLRLLSKQLQTFVKGKDTLYVNGYSGECSNDSRNNILILVDPYDTSDHRQDGYSIAPLERFFYSWKDRAIAPKPFQLQPFLVVEKKEKD